MTAPAQNLPRAALLGLALGLVTASVIFVASAWRNTSPDCDFPDTEECAQQLVIGAQVGRIQGFTAIGCALVGGGLVLLLRRR